MADRIKLETRHLPFPVAQNLLCLEAEEIQSEARILLCLEISPGQHARGAGERRMCR